ncbi:hypothetical protein MRX96_056683 [Rhipicephalus microplus]
MLKGVELSARESAWFLLRQEMSPKSRDVQFVKSCWSCSTFCSAARPWTCSTATAVRGASRTLYEEQAKHMAKTRRQARRQYNFAHDYEIGIYFGHSCDDAIRRARAKMAKLPRAETGNLPATILLVVHKAYMIACKVDVVDGLMNGAIETLGLCDWRSRLIEEYRPVYRTDSTAPPC